MNTLNKQAIAARVNTKLFKATAVAAMFLASSAAIADPREQESSQSLMPFTAASVGIAKNAQSNEQAAEHQQQALALLQQATPVNNMAEVALASNSLAPGLSVNPPTVNRVQLMGAVPMTREQVTAQHARQGIPSSSATSEDPYRAPIYHTFSIYDAKSRLFEDLDYDGFYRTFSVTFDVDVNGVTLNERADLFAELYLSRDGGRWVHYHTTDRFTIYGDSTQDDYEVLTTLYTGYATDHYDVLIDVYEVGGSVLVTSISADETDNLYALPLESRDRDNGNDVIIVDAGGALSVLGWLFLVASAGLRRRCQ
ncbi:choice-of-anchor H family protein [Shewanella sp.]|uniref:choice-of-anchor H family protein n=1 Tax=Shewanella sp. TaxID=50422 RepID=UPI003F2FCB1C